ncbi:MAG: hypothetical protein IJB90_03270 [Clostridia bacterium]|nr:hypothetical protein [Clostridia bacterium]
MNLKKVIICLATIILLINIIFIPKTFAFSSIIESGDGFIGAAELEEEEVIDEGKVKEVSSKIYNILLVCGIGVAVIVGAVLGVSFIISSAEGKAKIAETLVPYIVGCFVVFGAFGIWKVAINTGNSIIKGESAQATQYGKVKCTECERIITLDASSYKLRENGRLTCKNTKEDGTTCTNKSFIDV